ncbi:MAG: hypothetical protein IIY49_03320 [Eubacterium sp.]|nr:hypothetical protein [Eubacterium sp.]
MISLEITDVKRFITSLLQDESFDVLKLVKLELRTMVDFTIDGKINKAYFDDEKDVSDNYASWHEMKNHFYQMIRGSVLPLSFKIVLALPLDEVKKLVNENEELGIRPEDVSLITYNILYDREKMIVTTGLAMKTFSLDKIFPMECDEYLKKRIEKIVI